jgi:hypothetical protein
MIRPMKDRSFPAALVSSTAGTTLISIAAVWLATSLAFAPVTATPDAPSSYTSSPHRLYQLSPIPAGADWTS